MPIDLDSLRIQLREGLGLEGDDIQTLPNSDSGTKTGADTFLNRSYWEVLDKFPFREKEKSTTFVTVVGTNAYAVPQPFEALQKLTIEDIDSKKHDPLDRISIDDYEQRFVNNIDARGKPTHYFRREANVQLYPTPDKVYTLTIYYWTVLSDLASTGPQGPRNFGEIVLFGGLWRAQIQVNGDYLRAREARDYQGSLIAGVKPVEEKEEVDSTRSGVEVLGLDYDLK